MDQSASIVATTLLQVIALVGGVGCIAWLLTGALGNVSRGASFHFALANLWLTVGLELMLGRTEPVTWQVYWLGYWLGDAVALLCIASLREGLRSFLGLPSAWRSSLLVTGIFAVATLFIPFPEVAVRTRVTLFALMAAVLIFLIVADLLSKSRQRIVRWPMRLAATAIAVLGLVMLVRAAAMSFWPEFALRHESNSVGISALFLWIALALVLAINNALAGLVVSGLMARIQHLASHDMLTGCLNRHALDERLRRGVIRSGNQDTTLGLVMFDLDHFKQVNDRFGHLAGDAALQFVVETVRARLPPDAVIGRWGGEEFLILLPGSDNAGSRVIAEHIRTALETTPWSWRGQSLYITASFATTATTGTRPDLQALDRALYRAKTDGRNRIETTSLQTIPFETEVTP